MDIKIGFLSLFLGQRIYMGRASTSQPRGISGVDPLYYIARRAGWTNGFMTSGDGFAFIGRPALAMAFGRSCPTC